jgi:hypothetical protein
MVRRVVVGSWPYDFGDIAETSRLNKTMRRGGMGRWVIAARIIAGLVVE